MAGISLRLRAFLVVTLSLLTVISLRGCHGSKVLHRDALTRRNFLLSQRSMAKTIRNANVIANFDQRVSDYVAQNVLRFAHDVGRQLSEASPISKNEIFSPVSIMSALALLMAGAKGKSYQELKQLFGLDYDQELANNPHRFHEEFALMLEDLQQPWTSAVRLRKQANWHSTSASNNIRSVNPSDRNKPIEFVANVANGLFSQVGYSLNPVYVDVLRGTYHSDLMQLDFQRHSTEARNHINAWVNAKTLGKIPSIVEGDIPKATNVIMASTVYFKAFWENSFFESATALDKFYPDGASQPAIKVPMMATGGVFPFYDAPEHDCRIIGLPYRGNSTTMYVIQPNQSSRAKLKVLQRSLDAQKIEDMIGKMSQKSAVLVFPKMHFTNSINLKSVLSHMGIHDVFSSSQSDLSLISQQSSVSHSPLVMDRFNERPLIFTRFGGPEEVNGSITATTQPQDMADSVKVKRQVDLPSVSPRRHSLLTLEAQRQSVAASNTDRSDLFVDDILHKVDFDVNEHGTEAAAATLTYLRRSGTDVLFRAETPFLLLIRHDPTKLVLFYGLINEPVL